MEHLSIYLMNILIKLCISKVTYLIFSPYYKYQGKNLAAKDTNGLSDPYVRVTLLPEKKQRLDTKIKRRTLNPTWNETFYFEGILY